MNEPKEIKSYKITNFGENLKVEFTLKSGDPIIFVFSKKDFMSILSSMKQAAIAMGWKK